VTVRVLKLTSSTYVMQMVPKVPTAKPLRNSPPNHCELVVATISSVIAAKEMTKAPMMVYLRPMTSEIAAEASAPTMDLHKASISMGSFDLKASYTNVATGAALKADCQLASRTQSPS